MIASFDERMEERPIQQEEDDPAAEDVVEEAGDESFPASDAPGWTPAIAGPPPHESA